MPLYLKDGYPGPHMMRAKRNLGLLEYGQIVLANPGQCQQNSNIWDSEVHHAIHFGDHDVC